MRTRINKRLFTDIKFWGCLLAFDFLLIFLLLFLVGLACDWQFPENTFDLPIFIKVCVLFFGFSVVSGFVESLIIVINVIILFFNRNKGVDYGEFE